MEAEPPKRKRRWFQFSLRTLLLATTCLAAIVGFAVHVYRNWDECQIAAFDFGAGRTIIVTAATHWERSQPVFYRVVVDGQIVTPATMFTNCHGNATSIRFDVVQAENSNLVGLVEVDPTGDRELVLVHDFATGNSWPRLQDNETDVQPAVQRKWRDYFDRLLLENPTLPRSDYFSR